MAYSKSSFPILYGSENGNVLALQLSSLSGSDLAGSNATWSDTTAVTATWRSKEINFGSDNLLKTLRNIKIQMSGTSISVSLIYKREDGSSDTDTLTGQTLPLDNDGLFSIDNTNRLCRSVKIEISGSNLEIREVSLFYKVKRYR